MVRPQPQQAHDVILPQPSQSPFVEDEILQEPQAIRHVSHHRVYAKPVPRRRRAYEEHTQSVPFEGIPKPRVVRKPTRPQAVGRVSQPHAFGGAPQPLEFGRPTQLGVVTKPFAPPQHLGQPSFRVAPPPPQFAGSPHLQAFIRSPQPQATKRITRALILSLSVCYHARLQDRTGYEEGVARQFKNPLSLPGGDKQFRDEIRWLVLLLVYFKVPYINFCPRCQEVLLDNMKLGENIAKNAALRENVFMMAICIELRIPLFLVGKPGSSKSLAKAVIHASMRGKGSQTQLLSDFKEVDMFSYQCSQLSTPESVIEVFNTAKMFQNKQDTKNYVAVVVLDEVGLAEDSPNLPLKALHPLLEDGTEGAETEGKNDEVTSRYN